MRIEDLVALTLEEDIAFGDITTRLTVPAGTEAEAGIIAKAEGVLAGIDVAGEVFQQVDPSLDYIPLLVEGSDLVYGSVIARLQGPAAAILTAERTALNFLQHLSGIATLTRAYVRASGGRIGILDTRKTTPLLRSLEKEAVRTGGGCNHRFGLFDGVLIKDNHIRAAGGIEAAVTAARAGAQHLLKIEVETQSLAQVEEALAAEADIIMLDNLSTGDMRRAIEIIDGRVQVEISGGVTLERIPELAALGADFVSVGALTHSVKALDISLEIV
ncbi:MAG: carboxylating nicotinate-nucleotide diphosphorylase [bacterium]|jgi:nicotinate-nucleotide pyrophosphorylase (carboxylating)|nr:carboxylating nicotinate-nucleotide diphosphorylase [bacterium]MDD4558184.1 carboxylating nicotinate-nucleotide diphosphorylase [bacterium]